jgi:hypothetical protein
MNELYGAESKRQRYNYMLGQLDRERSSWIPRWQEIDDYILPGVGRFNLWEANRGDARPSKIFDDTATDAAETLAAGMLSGMTSPARPWFRLTTPDPDLARFGKVKEWLHVTAERLTTFFLQSNLYQVLPTNYLSVGGFGTACMAVEEDMDSLLRCYGMPIGSYYLANDARGRVAVFARKYRQTVRQVVQKFGERDKNGKVIWDNFSQFVRDAYAKGDYEQWVDIAHIIAPNPDYDPRKLHSKYKRFASCYFELGNSGGTGASLENDDKFLRERGFDFFPILPPRWRVIGEDAYGTLAPGIRCLGDVKQLQHGENRGLQAIDKMVTPPMSQPLSQKGNPLSHLPGGSSYHDDNAVNGAAKSLYDVRLDLSHLEAKQQGCRGRIERSFYKNLFQRFINESRSGITAAEIAATRDEQLLQVGPVVSQVNEDQNDPLVSLGFAFMQRQRWVPAAPPELQGMPLKVEYISPMAQAQKLMGITSMDRFLNVAGTVLKVAPGAAAKINVEKYLEVYGDQLGLVPGIVRSEDEAAEIRAEMAKQQQAQAQSEMIERGAAAARNLSQADMSGDNALTRLLQNQGQVPQ